MFAFRADYALRRYQESGNQNLTLIKNATEYLEDSGKLIIFAGDNPSYSLKLKVLCKSRMKQRKEKIR